MDYGRFFNAEQSGGSLSRCSRLRENYICRAAQKDLRGEARETSPMRMAYLTIRWSEAIERNEAYESFSAARWLVTEFKGNRCGD